MKVSDAISGGVLVAFGVAVFLYARTFPSPPPPAYGPALFPMLAAAAIALCGALLIIKTIMARKPVLSVHVGDWVRSPHHIGNLAITLGGIVAFLLVGDGIGFLMFAVLLLAAGYLWLGVRWYLAVSIAIAGAYAIQLLFASVLRIPLPTASISIF